MPDLRIRGLVRLADGVRRELSQPLTASRQAELAELVSGAIAQVERIVARHSSEIAMLPAPTRRAYQYLRSLDFASIHCAAHDSAASPARANISFAGLSSVWDGLLDRLAEIPSGDEVSKLYDLLCSTSTQIEEQIVAERLRTGDLTTRSRSIRGWLAFFSVRENFDAYLGAIRTAKPIFGASIRATSRFSVPALVYFRSASSLYRVRGYHNGTRITLATPMVTFSDSLFRKVAGAMFDGGRKQPIMEATACDEYREILARLEVLSGVQDGSAGVHHNLVASFERVAAKYFSAALARPKLTWSKTFTGRKFGHYDAIHDTVMISATLDRKNVPEYVVDFIMYHELLHKKLGTGWQNGRRTVHTQEFRTEEKRFEQYAAAEQALERLARGDALQQVGARQTPP